MPTAAELLSQYSTDHREGRISEATLIDATVRTGMKVTSQMIAKALIERDGARVQSGLFMGMAYHHTAAEGALAARLLGTYEAELHPHIERILQRDPLQIVDIGCAEGFYAVGLARKVPLTKILAFDISAPARDLCIALAEMNDVQGQVSVGGLVDHALLEHLSGPDTFIFCDIEGAEHDLLDPAKAPNLTQSPIIVETHPMAVPGVTKLLAERFSASHHVTIVHERVKTVPAGHWLETRPTADQFLATWEWRYRPTPWLVMEPKL